MIFYTIYTPNLLKEAIRIFLLFSENFGNLMYREVTAD